MEPKALGEVLLGVGMPEATFTNISMMGIPFGDDIIDIRLIREFTGGHSIYWLTLNGFRVRPEVEIRRNQEGREFMKGVVRLFQAKRP